MRIEKKSILDSFIGFLLLLLRLLLIHPSFSLVKDFILFVQLELIDFPEISGGKMTWVI